MTNVAVVGLGHWGPNLARNVEAIPEARLHTLCDVDRERVKHIGRKHPGAQVVRSLDDVLSDPGVDAVMLATPAHTHHPMGTAVLEAGKHLFVEKPMAESTEQAEALLELAEELGLVLMVGHVFLYNAAVRKVKDYIDSGELGDILYIYSQRLNLGTVRQDVNALWNFAPHDVSILCYWLDASPERVTARGYSYLQPEVDDVVFATFDFPGGVGANIHISWLDPNKVRRMTVVGSDKMVVYDDVSQDAKIKVYDKGVVRRSGDSESLGSYEEFGQFQLLTRAGDVVIPKLEFEEPLRAECRDFVNAISEGRSPLSDGREALEVVRVLEATDRALASPSGIEI